MPAPMRRSVAIGVAVAVGFAVTLSAYADPSLAVTIEPPSRADGATVAHIMAPTIARASLTRNAGRFRLRPETEWSGQPQSLLVLKAATVNDHEWLKLKLGVRPNTSAGWVPRERVVLSHTPYWIEVHTESRRVSIYRAGKQVRRFGAVVGKSGTPTPHGLEAIYEINRQPDPNAFLGPWALSLTAFSNVLQNFGGGPGRVAIHGRSGASLFDPIGSARSHGCIRVNNGPISWMASHVPRGTPVLLTS